MKISFIPIRKTCFRAHTYVFIIIVGNSHQKIPPTIFFTTFVFKNVTNLFSIRNIVKKCLVFAAVDRQLIFHRRTHKIPYRFFISSSSPYCLLMLVGLVKDDKAQKKTKNCPKLELRFPFLLWKC